MTIEELRHAAAAVAEEMTNAETIPPALRARFIDVRAELIQRGLFDPVLIRFDTASAPQASPREVGQQLATVAASLV